MISEKTVEAVYPLAELLDQKGICIEPIPTTPVDALVQAGHYPQLPTNVVHDPTIEERIINGSRMRDAFGVCQHDLTMDEVVAVIAETVRGNLQLARNTINPIVRSVTERTMTYIEQAENRFQERISIVPYQLPELWDSPALDTMVRRYEETPFRSIPLSLQFQEQPTTDQLLEWLKTGSQQLDTAVSAFVESIGVESVLETWNQLFGDPNQFNDAKTLEAVIPVKDILVGRQALNQIVIVHLLTRQLADDPPFSANISLSDYKAHLTDLRSQSGRAIVAVMNRRQNAIAREQLIGPWPALPTAAHKKVEIYVNGDIYYNWLESGGEADIILGAFISDQQRHPTTLITEKTRYMREWSRYSRTLAIQQRFNRHNDALEGLRLAMGAEINAVDETLLMVSRTQLHQRLEQVLKSLPGKFYETIYISARRIVCEVLFPHTMGLTILQTIDTVGENDPTLNPREAALLATIEIVTDWVAACCHQRTFSVNEKSAA